MWTTPSLCCSGDKPDALEVVRRIVERGAPINEIEYGNDTNTYLERVSRLALVHHSIELRSLAKQTSSGACSRHMPTALNWTAKAKRDGFGQSRIAMRK